MGYSVILEAMYNLNMKKEDEKTMRDIVKKAIKEELVGIYNAFIKISERFDLVDEKFAKIDDGFERIDERFDGIEGRLDLLERDMVNVKEKLIEIQRNVYSLKENSILVSNKLFKHDEILAYLQGSN